MAQGAFVRQYIGAPMSPSANRQCWPSMASQLYFADFFSCSVRHSYWRRVHRCANRSGGIWGRCLCSVRLAYFHTNRLLIELNQQETGRKDDGVAAQVRSRMATKYGRSNGSFHRVIACSSGGPGSIPSWDATFSDALCKGCRWLWSSLYIVVTPTWCAILTQRHAFGRISMRTLHATESLSATIPHRDLGGSCSSTSEIPNSN